MIGQNGMMVSLEEMVQEMVKVVFRLLIIVKDQNGYGMNHLVMKE